MGADEEGGGAGVEAGGGEEVGVGGVEGFWGGGGLGGRRVFGGPLLVRVGRHVFFSVWLNGYRGGKVVCGCVDGVR